MAQVTLRMRIRFPWWWRIYVCALFVFERTVGGVDTERAAQFLVRHTHFDVVGTKDRGCD